MDGQWGSPFPLTSDSLQDYSPFCVADPNGRIYVTWSSMNESTGANLIFYRRYANGSWSSRQTVFSSKTAFPLDLSMSVYNGSPCCGYTLFNLDNLVLNIGSSCRSGNSWIKRGITSNSNPSISNMAPDIEFDPSGRPRIVWTRYNQSGNGDLIFGGMNTITGSWSTTNLNNTSNINEDIADMVFAPNGNLHLVYPSNSDGDSEIFYRRQQ